MNVFGKIMGGFLVCTSVCLALNSHACSALATSQPGDPKHGEIEFRVGSPKSTVIGGARVIVINHDGKIIASGLTNPSGTWTTPVPFYQVQWNEHFSTKGVVTAIAVANGYNEQLVFIVPITAHTIQPVILRPIVPSGRNEPSASLGLIYRQELTNFVARYAEQLGLQKQPPILGEFGYAPWGPARKSGDVAR